MSSPPSCSYADMSPQEAQLYLVTEQPLAVARWATNDEIPYGLGELASLPPMPQPSPSPPPGAIEVERICNGTLASVSWYLPAAPPPARSVAAGIPASVLEGVVSATVAVPGLGIGISPAAGGITNLPAYFWLSGYHGQTLSGQGTEGGYTINVRAVPVSYRWSFGDGISATTASPGVAYPGTPGVSHTYTLRSDRSPLAVGGAYQVSVSVSFDTQYQLAGPGGGSAWVDFASRSLPPLAGEASVPYPVHEVVAALTTAPGG